jgi:Flp pilus assembly protein TadD
VRLPGWFEHGFNWAPFALICGLFFYTAYNPAMDEAGARISLATMFPTYDMAQSNLGIIRYLEGDLEGAVDINRATLAMHPSDRILRGRVEKNLGSALIELAETDIRSGHLPQAQERLREAYQLDATYADVLNNQGAELTQNGAHYDAAIKYQMAILMKPDHPYFRMNLAIAFASLGRLPEALNEAHVAARIKPEDATIGTLVRQLESAR